MKVIAVDDEKLLLDDLLIQLNKISGIESAAGFDDPREALAYLACNQADVAFLDINMQEMDGITLAKQMKELEPAIAVIFLTGYSEYAIDAFGLHASGYLMKPVTRRDIEEELVNLRPMKRRAQPWAFVRTFGGFELLCGGAPVKFERAKAKELFACLIDRRGASLTMEEISARLWEEDGYDASKLKQIHTFIGSMMKTLRFAGVDGAVVKQYNAVAVNPRKVDCDYFRFMDRDPEAIASFAGEYMTNYSWGEFTLGMLCQMKASLYSRQDTPSRRSGK